jgi:hypothetical protein
MPGANLVPLSRLEMNGRASHGAPAHGDAHAKPAHGAEHHAK